MIRDAHTRMPVASEGLYYVSRDLHTKNFYRLLVVFFWGFQLFQHPNETQNPDVQPGVYGTLYDYPTYSCKDFPVPDGLLVET